MRKTKDLGDRVSIDQIICVDHRSNGVEPTRVRGSVDLRFSLLV